jgi:hypothetical protein
MHYDDSEKEEEVISAINPAHAAFFSLVHTCTFVERILMMMMKMKISPP